MNFDSLNRLFDLVSAQLSSIALDPVTSYLLLFVFALVMFFVLLLVLVFSHDKTPKSHQTLPEKSSASSSSSMTTMDSSDDFLASEEGIITHINAAKAFISMKDYPTAASILDLVKHHGNDDQCAQAQDLYQEIEEYLH